MSSIVQGVPNGSKWKKMINVHYRRTVVKLITHLCSGVTDCIGVHCNHFIKLKVILLARALKTTGFKNITSLSYMGQTNFPR